MLGSSPVTTTGVVEGGDGGNSKFNVWSPFGQIQSTSIQQHAATRTTGCSTTFLSHHKLTSNCYSFAPTPPPTSPLSPLRQDDGFSRTKNCVIKREIKIEPYDTSITQTMSSTINGNGTIPVGIAVARQRLQHEQTSNLLTTSQIKDFSNAMTIPNTTWPINNSLTTPTLWQYPAPVPLEPILPVPMQPAPVQVVRDPTTGQFFVFPTTNFDPIQQVVWPTYTPQPQVLLPPTAVAPPPLQLLSSTDYLTSSTTLHQQTQTQRLVALTAPPPQIPTIDKQPRRLIKIEPEEQPKIDIFYQPLHQDSPNDYLTPPPDVIIPQQAPQVVVVQDASNQTDAICSSSSSSSEDDENGGLELLSNSIVQLEEKVEEEPVKIEEEIVQEKTNLDGLGLLCALAEQRIMEGEEEEVEKEEEAPPPLPPSPVAVPIKFEAHVDSKKKLKRCLEERYSLEEEENKKLKLDDVPTSSLPPPPPTTTTTTINNTTPTTDNVTEQKMNELEARLVDLQRQCHEKELELQRSKKRGRPKKFKKSDSVGPEETIISKKNLTAYLLAAKSRKKKSKKSKKKSREKKKIRPKLKAEVKLKSDLEDDDVEEKCILTQEDLERELRVLTVMGGLFYAGVMTAIQPPDIYAIRLDGERNNRPHILSREEVLRDAILEVTPGYVDLQSGTRICAYWSQQYRCLYPGTVADPETPNPNLDSKFISVEFDDGDSGRIAIEDIRLLPKNYPIIEYDPNPLLSLTKRKQRQQPQQLDEEQQPPEEVDEKIRKKHHRKKKKHHRRKHKCKDELCKHRRHRKHHRKHHKKKHRQIILEEEQPVEEAVATEEEEQWVDNETAGTEEEEEEEEVVEEEEEKIVETKNSSSRMAAFLPVQNLWTWYGPGIKRRGRTANGRGGRKEFYRAIIRGDSEIIELGDAAVFLSTGRPDRPYIGRIVSMWETSFKNIVRVRWFYHPEETVGCPTDLKYPGALFESPHNDTNEIATISHKCEVLSLKEYREKMGDDPQRYATVYENNDTYYLAGNYDPSLKQLNILPDIPTTSDSSS